MPLFGNKEDEPYILINKIEKDKKSSVFIATEKTVEPLKTKRTRLESKR